MNNRHFQFSLRHHFIFIFLTLQTITCFLSICFVGLVNYNFFNSNNLILLGLAVLLCVLISSITIMSIGSKHMIKPITELNEAVKQVAQGNFNVKVYRRDYPKDKANFHNEIDELARNFNKMAEDLQSLENLRNDFISNISHEIKTPVAALTGIADLIIDDKINFQTKKEMIDLMQSEAARLNRLCEAILQLSRLNNNYTVKKEPVRIDEQLRKASIILAEKWKEKEIEFDFNCPKIIIQSQKDLTMTIWTNLIENAIKYSHKKVSIKIEAKQKKDYISIKISDNGLGIKDNEKDLIFQQFYQTDKSHRTEGYGLGLSLVKKIIDLLEGKIKLESQINKGTSFTVILPIKY